MRRRDFLAGAAAAGFGALTANALGQSTASAKQLARIPERKGKSVAGLRHKPMEKVRVAVIGVGARGSGHVVQLAAIEGVEVKAICDLYKDWADNAAANVVKAGQPAPTLYVGDPYAYKEMMKRDDIDAVFIATPWQWHTPMALCAMQNGKHAFTEVPAALTLDECWALVDTAEETQLHCMMMENVNYGREELMVLNMVRMGALGELLHGEAAYIHDLRGQMHEEQRGTGSWRTLEYMSRNGNLYPTHGLGPVSQYMDICRGDRFDFLSSVSCNSRMREIYARENFPEGHKWRRGKFVCGDLNTSIIRTVKGRTVMVQWDEQLPRPYTRHNLIQGTKGCWGGFPDRLTIEGKYKTAEGKVVGTEDWMENGDLDKVYAEFDHPLYKKQGELAKKMGGHGGMDFLMLWRIIYCLRNGEPLDQNVYESVSWSAVTPLSEYSVANRGASVDFPDFTRGSWKTDKPLGIVDPKV
ncbi:MAG: Gfo/Idh/MocA family oxidoreductase [Fimbriimonadaceae bacterium]|nr:Gfo/Idh/MocA family oxidoreductase [Fimbriimonadaceae bacterium]